MQPEFESKLISTDIQTLINLFDNEFYLPAEPIDADMPLQFSGSKKSGVLMLTYQSLTTEELEQLNKIAAFIQLNLEDVSFCVAEGQSITREKLLTEGFNKIICWGVNPSSYFEVVKDLYTPIQTDGITILGADTLKQLIHDIAAKKVLAAALKLMFLNT